MKVVNILRWVAVAAATLSLPAPAWANTAVFMDGTRVNGAATTAFDLNGFIPQGYEVDVVPYPAQTWPLSGKESHSAGYSAAIGVGMLMQTVPNALGQILVVGGSLGAMTIDEYLSQLPANTPAPERLSFAVLGDPYRGGILSGIAAGTYIPILDLIRPAIVDTPYDVTVIQNQYDAIGDFPDQPGNWVAVVNALLGSILYHNGPAYCDAVLQVQSGELTPVSVDTNSLGGTTTTYVIPRALPITVVLKQLGVSESDADALDQILKPLVDTGYSRNVTAPAPAPSPAAGAAAAAAAANQNRDQLPSIQSQNRKLAMHADRRAMTNRNRSAQQPTSTQLDGHQSITTGRALAGHPSKNRVSVDAG